MYRINICSQIRLYFSKHTLKLKTLNKKVNVWRSVNNYINKFSPKTWKSCWERYSSQDWGAKGESSWHRYRIIFSQILNQVNVWRSVNNFQKYIISPKFKLLIQQFAKFLTDTCVHVQLYLHKDSLHVVWSFIFIW